MIVSFLSVGIDIGWCVVALTFTYIIIQFVLGEDTKKQFVYVIGNRHNSYPLGDEIAKL
jgi:hypothetical protein